MLEGTGEVVKGVTETEVKKTEPTQQRCMTSMRTRRRMRRPRWSRRIGRRRIGTMMRMSEGAGVRDMLYS